MNIKTLKTVNTELVALDLAVCVNALRLLCGATYDHLFIRAPVARPEKIQYICKRLSKLLRVVIN